jgi:hypothetical protein
MDILETPLLRGWWFRWGDERANYRKPFRLGKAPSALPSTPRRPSSAAMISGSRHSQNAVSPPAGMGGLRGRNSGNAAYVPELQQFTSRRVTVLGAGCIAHLRKPFRSRVLIDAINRAVA